MNDQNSTPEAVQVPIQKPAKAKKGKPAKAKAQAKPAADGKPPVTKPQIRMLQVLAKSKHPLNDAALAVKAGVARSWVAGHVFKSCAANTRKSLVEQGLVKAVEVDVDGKKERCYELKAAGRKLAERL